MSTQTVPSMNLPRVDFEDLFARHLGRHSQFGINVAHLGALYGMWFGIYAAVKQAILLAGVPVAWPVTLAMAVAYLAMIAVNAPRRVILATAVFLALFVASVIALPKLPGWSIPAFLVMVPIFYKLQSWSHKVWNTAASMSEFNRRFPPGRELSLILLVNEVPICVYYLIFRQKDWRR